MVIANVLNERLGLLDELGLLILSAGDGADSSQLAIDGEQPEESERVARDPRS